MKSKIEKLSRFTADYFNFKEEKLYSQKTDNNSSIARYFIWYYLHINENVSIGLLSKEFFRTRRTIFLGISKLKSMIKNQRMYNEMYNKFIDEYKKATPK